MKRETKKPKAAHRKTGRKVSEKRRPAKATKVNQQPVDEQHSNHAFPVVGVGASAGGLEAFRELLKHLPADTGMALVFVQHLDPKHESMLAELLGRSTAMEVTEVEDGIKVEPNHIFVIPRNSEMTIQDGVLRLSPRAEGRGQHYSIDKFLRSLAQDQTNRAIGVILSGTATDGTLGLEAIKAEGGITFAQNTESAKYDGMPRSAVASGCVDFVLTPEEIAHELARLSNHPYVVSVGKLVPSEVEIPEPPRNGFKRILNILLKAHGVDFTLYKSNTLERRTMRRMLLNKVEGYEEYARFLSTNPDEVENLYQDLLIGVTSFFRHPETFELLKENIFPQLIESRRNDEPVRVWVLGCSTGEEAYSIAMSFAEFANERSDHIPVQIFATDVNDRGIDKARAGIYPKNLTEDVSPDRLRRFFIEEESAYRVSKPIRDMCVFAQQNVLADPPFSRMDLISCQNLLIYLEPTAQKKVIPLLHYALNPHGILWLGSSETIGLATDLFEAEDKKHKFYSKKPTRARRGVDFPLGNLAQAKDARGRAALRVSPDRNVAEANALSEADRIIMSRFAPASVLINEDFEILQFRGRTAPYLEPPPGKATLNLLKMAREGLLVPLRSALVKARKNHEVVRKENLLVQHDGSSRHVNFEVIPIKHGGPREHYFLVLFEVASTAGEEKAASKQARPKRQTEASEVKVLSEELSSTRDYLQSVVEQYEAATEELQSANEEIQSSNEELQSINEELETAKEELESSNEELTTVNEELQNRNSELGRANSDLVNLLASVQMPIVMLDNDLRIRRFTTTAEKVLNLIATDVGRHIGDIRINIDVPDLEQVINDVIEAMNVRELEVRDTRGCWYLMRIRPYKTVENKIDGAVLILVDIDALKRHEAQLQESRDYAVAIIDTVLPLVILDESLRVQSANRSFYEFLRVSPEETEGKFVYDLANRQWDDPRLRKLLSTIVSSRTHFQDFEIECEFPETGRRTLSLSAREIRHEASRRRLILLGIQDVTSAKRMEKERDDLIVREQAARAAAEEANRIKDEFLAICSHELRTPLSAIQGWAEMLTRGGLDDDSSQHGLEIILRNVRAQTQIIKDLLDVSRVIAGKLQLAITVVELVPLIEAAVESIRPTADAKDIKITTSLDRTIDPFFGDIVRLQQIVWNLLSNAVKFTPNGGSVDVRLHREDESVAIVVADTGIGIEPEFLPHVFDLFRQADSSTNRSHGGLGLGLAIVRNLASLHNGDVTVESGGAGKGSTFKVILPRIAPTLESIAEPETRLATGEGQSRRLMSDMVRLLTGARVLVVDDDADSREMVNASLTAYGSEVRMCASSDEALKTIQEWLPQIIISDIGMPVEDGYTLIRRIRELPPKRGGDIPALALTGYATLEDHKRTLAAGFQMHLAKPIELEKLAACAAKLIERGNKEPRNDKKPKSPRAASP